jgi:MoaA/NifB/PqqE/SkfB family radical SAM enzyme
MQNKPTFYRLCRDTFIRPVGDLGYITSQLTKHDRLYDGAGAVFLSGISRAPRTFNEILSLVLPKFIDPPVDIIAADLSEFLGSLEQDQFIIAGENPEGIDQKEPHFSYSSENPKTITHNFTKNPDDIKYPDTGAFLSSIFQKKPSIFSCQIELTNCCNERCLHCYIPHEVKKDVLKTAMIVDVLDQLHQMGTLALTLSGGEPLLHPDLDLICQYARKMDFSINILSNLTLLTSEHIALFKEINPAIIQTSLYSMKATEHDTITKLPGSHKKTLASLEALIDADIPVQISCPVMRTNYQSYRHVVEWAKAHRCKAQTDFIMMARTDFSTNNLAERLSLDETQCLIRDILEVDRDYDGMLLENKIETNVEDEAKKSICGVGLDSICLAGNGIYYPCSGWRGYSALLNARNAVYRIRSPWTILTKPSPAWYGRRS